MKAARSAKAPPTPEIGFRLSYLTAHPQTRKFINDWYGGFSDRKDRGTRIKTNRR